MYWQYWQHLSGEIYAVQLEIITTGPRARERRPVAVYGPLLADQVTHANLRAGTFDAGRLRLTWLHDHWHNFMPYEVGR